MSKSDQLSVQCPKCSKQLQAPLAYLGKIGKCKGCDTKFKIEPNPATATSKTSTIDPAVSPVNATLCTPTTVQAKPISNGRSSTPAPTLTTAHLDAELVEASVVPSDMASVISELIQEGEKHFQKSIESRVTHAEISTAITKSLPRRPISSAYLVHLFLVAGAMAALPVIYLAIVVSAAVFVGYYTTQIVPSWIAHAPRGRAGAMYGVGVIAPAVIGVILVFFLTKPIFFRITGDPRRRTLSRASQPNLFDLVDRICDATGAPRPHRIDVDYAVNASASPDGGVSAILRGRMVLTIGIPLFAGLTSRQFAGVLAHEFGHFSQKAGMSATQIISRVNWWFARVVYQRDSFDEMLRDWTQASDIRIGLFLQLTQLCIFASRAVLWVLMVIGRIISSGLLRQMEFDADRSEYGLVGSKTFAETSFAMHTLSIGQRSAIEVVGQLASNGTLADDLILLGQYFHDQLTPDQLKSIKDEIDAEEGGLLDSHPPTSTRVRRAIEANSEGVFQLNHPARSLLLYYDEISKGVTQDFYRDVLDSHINPNALTSSQELIEKLRK